MTANVFLSIPYSIMFCNILTPMSIRYTASMNLYTYGTLRQDCINVKNLNYCIIQQPQICFVLHAQICAFD